jgi:polyhydroxyalkanoate depolymerase
MMYHSYEWQRLMMAPWRALAAAGADGAPSWPAGADVLRHFQASCQLLAESRITHERPDFGISAIEIDGRLIPVQEEVVAATPFCSLLRFSQTDARAQPRILVAAPLSGHFSTLLQSTIKTLVRDHVVYVTDWHNMRNVPAAAGPFGFDDYVTHIIQFQAAVGPGGHVLAVCQPCVQVLAAVAVMAEQNHPATPRSMTLMAGPIDTRINPTKVNALAMGKPIEWFSNNLITTVPWPLKGAGRAVYPGFLQLTAFMSMQPERHVRAFCDLYDHLAHDRRPEAKAISDFYREYFAVLDLDAKFYLETVDFVFQRALLARGALTYQGNPVNTGLIRKTALLTVEGERDDICAPGQTLAAQDLCSGLRPYLKRHHLQAGVGHYGVFSGRRWETQIYPIVQNFVLMTEQSGTPAARRTAPLLKIVSPR